MYISFTGRQFYVTTYLIIYLYKVEFLEKMCPMCIKMKLQKMHMSPLISEWTMHISEVYLRIYIEKFNSLDKTKQMDVDL